MAKKPVTQLPARDDPAFLDMIRERSTDVFLKPLNRFMDNGPSDEAIKTWARINPDGWARAVSTMARLAGWSEKSEVTHKHRGVVAHLHAMSDAELLAAARDSVGSFSIVIDQTDDKTLDNEPQIALPSVSLDGGTG